MRIGILGGTFDPIHRGHLEAARAARDLLRLDRVLFVPAHVPPHRARSPRASAYHRFAMIALAILGDDGLVASDMELTRPGPSFSVETLRALQQEGWHALQMFFISGIDAFAEIATWREYPALLDEAHFVVVTRPGYPADALRGRLPSLAPRFVDASDDSLAQRLAVRPTAIVLLDARTTEVSSTEVRRRIASHAAVADLVPAGVDRYIRQHHLYESRPTAPRLHGQI
jgi:nicotinate-nucleotide adenylyltransferase